MYRGLGFQKKVLHGIALALCVATLLTVPVGAQNNSGVEKITMSPSSRTIKADAGSVIKGNMQVINSGGVAFDFTVYASPYSVKGEDYDPDFSGKVSNTKVQEWVRFDKTLYSLEPGREQEVPYSVHIPEDAAPGGHYGVVFAETKARELGSTGVARQKRVGQVLYITVNGNYKSEGRIASFILPFWQTKPPVVSSARVTNSGNVDFETEVKTVAKDIFGRTKFTYTGDPVVLPDTTRLIEMEWEKAPNFGFFRVSQTVKFLGQEHKNNGFVLIAPRWFPVLLLVIILSGASYAIIQRRKTSR